MSNHKILIDEMDDGWDEKLRQLGFEAYSVKKLRAEGKKLRTDYSVINYARENDMVLVTRDTESGQACQENNFRILHDFLFPAGKPLTGGLDHIVGHRLVIVEVDSLTKRVERERLEELCLVGFQTGFNGQADHFQMKSGITGHRLGQVAGRSRGDFISIHGCEGFKDSPFG